MKQCFFAVDLGATSGRTILGTFTPEGLEMEDVNRFPNRLIETGGHFYWDIYELYRNIITLSSRSVYLSSLFAAPRVEPPLVSAEFTLHGPA